MTTNWIEKGVVGDNKSTSLRVNRVPRECARAQRFFQNLKCPKKVSLAFFQTHLVTEGVLNFAEFTYVFLPKGLHHQA